MKCLGGLEELVEGEGCNSRKAAENDRNKELYSITTQ